MINPNTSTWIELLVYLKEQREKLIKQLILSDNEQARGGIKFIDRLIALPGKQAGASAAAKEIENDGTGY